MLVIYVLNYFDLLPFCIKTTSKLHVVRKKIFNFQCNFDEITSIKNVVANMLVSSKYILKYPLTLKKLWYFYKNPCTYLLPWQHEYIDILEKNRKLRYQRCARDRKPKKHYLWILLYSSLNDGKIIYPNETHPIYENYLSHRVCYIREKQNMNMNSYHYDKNLNEWYIKYLNIALY